MCSTFNVPNLQDNVAVGKSNNKALASTGGANNVSITSTGNIGGSTANATLSTAQLASHNHTVTLKTNPGDPASPNNSKSTFGTTRGNPTMNTGSQGSGTGHSHNMSATFSGDATSVLQPYLTIIYIIKT